MYINKIGGEIKFTAEKVLPTGHPFVNIKAGDYLQCRYVALLAFSIRLQSVALSKAVSS